MKLWMTRLALVAAFGLAFAGCTKKDDAGKTGETTEGTTAEGTTPPKAADMPAFVEMIPADTPYVIVGLKAMPEAVTTKLFDALDPLLAQAQSELKAEMAAMGEPASDEEKLAKAIMEELDGKLNAKGLESLGISTTPTWALYGVGLLPVMRVELKDPEKLKAAIGRVEKKAGVKAPILKSGDVEYYGAVNDGVHVVVAIQGDELVFGVTVDALAKETVPMILGTQKPAKSIKSAGTLDTLAKANGYVGYGLGYVDNMMITRTLLGEAEGLNGKVLAEMQKAGAEIGAVDPVCKTELKGLAALAPRFVFGSKEVSEKLWVSHFLVETRADLAQDLATLAAPVPGLGADNSSLVSFGFGIDVGKALDFAKKKVAAIKASPYKCEMLAGLNEGAVEMEQGLQQPMPPVVSNLRGLMVNVKSADTSSMPPKDIKAIAVLAADKPAELLQMAKAMGPPALAKINLTPDGKPVALPAAELGIPPFVQSPHAAMTDKGIAISVGAGEEQNLGGALSAEGASPAPLLSFGYDVGEFMGAVQKQTAEMMAGMPEEFRKEQEAQLKATMALSKIFGVVLSNVTLGEKGIVIEQRLHLK